MKDTNFIINVNIFFLYLKMNVDCKVYTVKLKKKKTKIA